MANAVLFHMPLRYDGGAGTLLLPFLGICAALAFSMRVVHAQEQQLDELRRNIERMQAEISNFEKSEKATLDYLRSLEHEVDLTSRLIGKLRKQETEKRAEVEKISGGLRQSEIELVRLQEIARRRAVFFYKYGRIPDIEMLLTSRSPNQVLLWAEYQRRMSENDRRLMAGLSAKREQIRVQKDKLLPGLEKQAKLLAEKLKQEESLRERKQERQQVLKSIRKDKSFYQAQLAEKKQAADVIARLIAADAGRENASSARRASASPPSSGGAGENAGSNATASASPNAALIANAGPPPDIVPPRLPSYEGSFINLKRRLPWPVTGNVVAQYGTYRHPVLKTITTNLGIDIATPPGAAVRSVAPGRVMTITWQRGYGNLAIINHADGYYTVYTHLGDILVAPNQEIAGGEVLGRISEDAGAEQVVLHFQIWQRTKDRRSQNLNPQEWLQ
jgi:septal ring factor EnvC (AmiA/AmiB activator)